MPTFNEHADESGYYIVARPSGMDKPITYQIESRGDPIVEAYGLSDQSEISWETIEVLKLLELIYTNESGVIGSDDFEPDPEKLEKTSLNDHEARRLVKAIWQNKNLSTKQLHDICSQLNIDPPIKEIIDTSIPLTPDVIEEIEAHGDIVNKWGRDAHAIFWKTTIALEELQITEYADKTDQEWDVSPEGHLAGHITRELIS